MSEEGITLLRGHPVRRNPDTGDFYFVDTGEPTASTWQDRPCGHCGLHNTPEGHDGCLGTLPDVMNACCGHGESHRAYVQFWDKTQVDGHKALDWIGAHKEEV